MAMRRLISRPSPTGAVRQSAVSLFSGTHDIHAVAQASGSNGSASIRAQSIALDGVRCHKFCCSFSFSISSRPKYPNVGITSTFKLPLRIDSAVVDTGRVRLMQK